MLTLLLAGMLEASGAFVDACALEPSIVPGQGGGYDVVVEAPHGIVPGVDPWVTERVVVAQAYAEAARALLRAVVLDNFGQQVPAQSIRAILASRLAVGGIAEPYRTCHTVEERDERTRRATQVCVGEGALSVVEMQVHESDGGFQVWRSSVAVERAGDLMAVLTSMGSETHTLNGEQAHVMGGSRMASGHLSMAGVEVAVTEIPGTDQPCIRVRLLGVEQAPGQR